MDSCVKSTKNNTFGGENEVICQKQWSSPTLIELDLSRTETGASAGVEGPGPLFFS